MDIMKIPLQTHVSPVILPARLAQPLGQVHVLHVTQATFCSHLPPLQHASQHVLMDIIKIPRQIPVIHAILPVLPAPPPEQAHAQLAAQGIFYSLRR